MIGIAAALLALSVGDLVAGGFTGEPQRLWRVLLGTVCASLASWMALSESQLPPGASLCAWIGVTASTLCWLFCKLMLARADQRRDGTGADDRREGPSGRRWASGALVVLGLTLFTALVFAAPLHSDLPRLTSWARGLPFARAQKAPGAEIMLLLAILLFLTAPANSVVRTLLTVARTEWKISEQKVRGGRYIGVIERWMIFSLARAGEPTAAALIVSAKSLLRFPELSKAANEERQAGAATGPVADIDAVTEYFLLGSLASWGLALVFVLLLV
jgi:hypothetical protein